MEAKSKPKEICGPKINPPKSSMPNFRTLKKVAKQIWLYFICRTTWPRDTRVPPQIFRLFWIPPQNPYLNEATPKKYFPNFPTQKTHRMKDFKPKKILWSSPWLEISKPPPPHRVLMLNRTVDSTYLGLNSPKQWWRLLLLLCFASYRLERCWQKGSFLGIDGVRGRGSKTQTTSC